MKTVKLPLVPVIAVVGFSAFTLLNSFRIEKKIENFDEINVKRINVIEKDGTIRMVISNKELQHSGRMNGKDMEKRERQAGMIFFNDEGDECGGFVYEAKKKEDGSIISGMSLTYDKYKNDQVLQILNSESYKNGKSYSSRGFIINDYASDEIGLMQYQDLITEAEKITDETSRKQKIREIRKKYGAKNLLFLGKGSDSQGLFINDKNGQPKLMIYVNEKGEPKIQTMNEKGEVKDFIIEEVKK